MHVSFELSLRLREVLGSNALHLELPEGADLALALHRLAGHLRENRGLEFLRDGALHPSLLVVMNGVVQGRDGTAPLRDGSSIQLLLPVAGG